MNNPVLSCGSAGSWDALTLGLTCVIKDEAGYKMYYTGGHALFTPESIGVATSSDGKIWAKYPGNPVISPGAPGSWDRVKTINGRVLEEAGLYRMWYAGFDGSVWRTGYATSPNGLDWTKYNGNPVMESPAAILKADNEYKGWFASSDGIGLATSADGLSWEQYPGNPVMKFGGSGSFDSSGGWTWSVINCSGKYRMWYTAWDGRYHSIGYADSPDGFSWTKNPNNPIFTKNGSGWEKDEVQDACVLFDDGGYKLWYGGVNQGANPWSYQIGYAEGWNPDLHAPVPRYPAESNWTNSSRPTFGWTFNDTNGRDSQAGYQVQIGIDGNFTSLAHDSSRRTSSADSHTADSVIADGAYYWRVRVWTGDGELSDWSAQWIFTVDTTPPVIINATINGGAAYAKSNYISLGIQASDGAGSGLGEMSLSFDNVTWNPREPFTQSKDIGLPAGEGLKTIYVRTWDRVGNAGPVSKAMITADTMAPTSSIMQLPDSADDVNFTVRWTGEDQTSGILSYDVQYRAANDSWMDWLLNTSLDNAQFTGKDGQTYSFRVRAVDRAGNMQTYPAAGADSITIIVMNPVITILKPEENTKIGGFYSTAGISNHPKVGKTIALVQFRIDDGPWQAANGTLTWTARLDTTRYKNGPHTFQARAFDGIKYSAVESRPLVINNEEGSVGSIGAPSSMLLIILSVFILVAAGAILVAARIRHPKP